MKKVLGLTLLAVMMLGISTVSAQKMARINVQEIVVIMPEFEQAQKNLEAFGRDLQEQMEAIQVEFNNKYADFEKNQATMAASVKQIKQQELQQLQQRYTEFQQIAQQDMQRKEAEVMNPIYTKADEAVKKVAAAGGYVAIFNTAGDQPSSAGLAYFDPSLLKDITSDVKKELGIQ